jgi:hypothetical protein
MSALSGLMAARAWAQRFRIHDGALEALKWIAVVAMVLDHANKYVLQREYEWMVSVGRVAFPLFALVLAYKLSLAADPAGAAWRAARRLLVVGLIATAPFIAAGHIAASWWWPLNVMFTLAAGAAMVSLVERGLPYAALGVFISTGWLAEFFWPGSLLLLCAYRLFTRPSELWAALAIFAMGGLSLINGSHWAVVGVILFLLAASVPARFQAPRLKWFFYAFYPAHFAVIVAVQRIWDHLR